MARQIMDKRAAVALFSLADEYDEMAAQLEGDLGSDLRPS